MRHARDQFAKDLLDLLLSPHGGVRQEAVIAGTDAQRADLRFIPRRGARRARGLLGRITRRPALFEHFSTAPSVDEILAGLRKVLTWRHHRAKKKRRTDVLCWMLCAGRPDTVLQTLPLSPTPRWPAGVYGTGFPIRVVVIDELPKDSDTILLRLLGKGPTAIEAERELERTRDDFPALDELYGLLVEFHESRTDEEEDSMGLQLARYYAARYRAWKEETRAQGHAQGHAEGRLLGAIEGRLRRVLTEDERARLSRRVARDGHDDVLQRVLGLDDPDLGRWVAGKRVRPS